jgi:hypothetical protein
MKAFRDTYGQQSRDRSDIDEQWYNVRFYGIRYRRMEPYLIGGSALEQSLYTFDYK